MVGGIAYGHTQGVAGVYLASVGFRPAGFRLVSPVHVAADGRTLTLTDLVATPDGTELRYELSGLKDDEGYTARQDRIAIRSGGLQQMLERGSFSFTTDVSFASRSPLRRRIASTSVISLRSGPIDIAITIEGVGEFRLAAELRPFGPETDGRGLDVNTSVMHDGITVNVGRVGVAPEETAVEIAVAVGDGECCVGIGGYQGHRGGPTALSLRDQSGRVYAEHLQSPGNDDSSTFALFEPLHPDARDVELEIPYVFLEQPDVMPEVALPVTDAVERTLGSYSIRVLGTTPVPGEPSARSFGYRAPALGVDLDLGGWQGDRRVLIPGRVVLDGKDYNLGYRLRDLNSAKPEPVKRIEITGLRIDAARTLGFTRPCIQVRGPWRVKFRVAPP